MKKILLPLLALALFACNEPKEKEKDYVSFSGKISNNVNDSIQIRNQKWRRFGDDMAMIGYCNNS